MRKKSRGFSLVEIMITVVIVGLLASLAVPAFASVRSSAQNSRLISDMRTFSDQMQVYAMEEGVFPADSNSGALPPELDGYINTSSWFTTPSIGGQWDVERDSFGIISAVGVHGYTVEDDQLAKFDAKYDDGNLSTGRFRKLAGDRYYLILEE